VVPFFPSSLKLGMGIQIPRREKLMDICRIEIIFLLIAYIVCFCLLLSGQGVRMLSSRLRTVLFVGQFVVFTKASVYGCLIVPMILRK
jgi:hypothetical protein